MFNFQSESTKDFKVLIGRCNTIYNVYSMSRLNSKMEPLLMDQKKKT